MHTAYHDVDNHHFDNDDVNHDYDVSAYDDIHDHCCSDDVDIHDDVCSDHDGCTYDYRPVASGRACSRGPGSADVHRLNLYRLGVQVLPVSVVRPAGAAQYE